MAPLDVLLTCGSRLCLSPNPAGDQADCVVKMPSDASLSRCTKLAPRLPLEDCSISSSWPTQPRGSLRHFFRPRTVSSMYMLLYAPQLIRRLPPRRTLTVPAQLLGRKILPGPPFEITDHGSRPGRSTSKTVFMDGFLYSSGLSPSAVILEYDEL